MTKWQKTAKLLSALLLILFFFLAAQSLLLGFFNARSAFALLTGEETQTFVSGVSLDYLHFYSASGGISIPNSAMATMNLLSLSVYLGLNPLLCYGIHLLRNILASTSQGRPFSGTGKTLQKLGWVSLAAAVIQNASAYAMNTEMVNQIGLSKLFLGGIITEVTFQFQMDYTFFLSALVVFLLGWIFRYGEELQQLSDETL